MQAERMNHPPDPPGWTVRREVCLVAGAAAPRRDPYRELPWNEVSAPCIHEIVIASAARRSRIRATALVGLALAIGAAWEVIAGHTTALILVPIAGALSAPSLTAAPDIVIRADARSIRVGEVAIPTREVSALRIVACPLLPGRAELRAGDRTILGPRDLVEVRGVGRVLADHLDVALLDT